MKKEEQQQSQEPGDAKQLGWRLSLSWEGKPKSKEEKQASSLIWAGRFLILLSLAVMLGVEVSVIFGWLAAAILLTYTLYVVICWRAVRAGRASAAYLAAIALALAVLFIWSTVNRMLGG